MRSRHQFHAHGSRVTGKKEEDIMKTYFGFALADSMFNGDCTINRRSLSIEEVKERVAQGVESCCNPSHKATIDAGSRWRFPRLRRACRSAPVTP